MDVTLAPISSSAKHRAQQAGSNGHRCLIQDITNDVQVLHTLNVLDRKLATNERVMHCLEWNWGLSRGSLNFDTSRNIFFLGSAVHDMYKEGRWALLPEDRVVRKYFVEDEQFSELPLDRAEFPIIVATAFQYRLIPIEKMEKCWVIRQTGDPASPNGLATHLYPFDTLPALTSHIHPTFAILQLGYLLRSEMDPDLRRSLIARHPLLDKIIDLYCQWISFPPPRATVEPTYIFPTWQPASNNACDDQSTSDDDSTFTSPRRVKIRCRRQLDQAVQTDSRPAENQQSNSMNSPNEGKQTTKALYSAPPSRKRGLDSDDLCHSHPSKRCALNDKSTGISRSLEPFESGWKEEDILGWARDCSASSESPHDADCDPPICTEVVTGEGPAV